MKKRSLLGELLIEHGEITREQLQEALNDQKRWGGKIGQHFVRQGTISQEQLLDFLSIQLGIAKIDFTQSPISRSALELVPKRVCDKYKLVPVAKKEDTGQKRLLVAMADPMDYDAIREVEFVSNCVVATVLADKNEIQRVIEHCFTSEGIIDYPQGLPPATGIELDIEHHDDSEAVIFTMDGQELPVDTNERGVDTAFRVLVDLLHEKNLIDVDDFRERLKKAKKDLESS
jgi:type IV pilus assembly protein PilB